MNNRSGLISQYRTSAGSVLIVSLWIMTVMMILVLSVAYRGMVETRLAGYEHDQYVSSERVLSGIPLARAIISADEKPTVDSQYDEWYNATTVLESLWPHNNLSLSIVDEESKLPVNMVQKATLEALLRLINEHEQRLSIDPETVAERVCAWRGDGGAGLEEGLETEYKNAPFESLEELLLIPGIEKKDYDLLTKYLTVYVYDVAYMKININTASDYVIQALIEGLAGDESRKRELITKILDTRAQLAAQESTKNEGDTVTVVPYFTPDDITPYEFLERIQMTSDVLSVSLVMQLMQYITVDSRIFHIEIETGEDRVQTSARCILGVDQNKRGVTATTHPLRVLSWHEEYYGKRRN